VIIAAHAGCVSPSSPVPARRLRARHVRAALQAGRGLILARQIRSRRAAAIQYRFHAR